MMKIIFLDIDGVLNNYGSAYDLLYGVLDKMHLRRAFMRNYDIFGIRKRNVKLLSKIIKKTGAKVVLSSSWRGSWYMDYDLKSPRQKLLEDMLRKYNIEVIGITPRISCDGHYSHRAHEIVQWLSQHESEVGNFIILDDESFDLQVFKDKELILTSDKVRIFGREYRYHGLRMKHVKRAIEILNESR